jgi:valyl-tRNA synthetase
VAVVDDVTTVHMALAGILDAAKEIEKLDKREADAVQKLDALRAKFEGVVYQEKTPQAVKEMDADRLEKMAAELQVIRHAKEEMQKLLTG